MGKAGLPLGCALAAVSGCLLYTDTINQAPTVKLLPPAAVHPRSPATFKAEAQDPDGDQVQLGWSTLPHRCPPLMDSAWAGAVERTSSIFMVTPMSRERFCVRVVARDEYGAEAHAMTDVEPANRPPIARLEISPATVGGAPLPIFSTVKLDATGSGDPDGDEVNRTFDVKDATGMAIKLDECGAVAQCFSAERSGAYTATLAISDGVETRTTTVPFNVAEDQPPCIAQTDPVVAIPVVVLPADGPARRFEVKQVRDDGHPFPAGPRGRASFHWFAGRGEAGALARIVGHDRPELDVGATLIDDVRPGDVARVRVEVRDPEREKPSELRALDACADRAVCEQPAGCVRWITWTLRFQ